MDSHEDLYRESDALYRILDKQWHIEHNLQRLTAAQFTALRIQHSVIGVLIAVSLAVLSIIVSVTDTSWTSGPAWTIYVLCAVLVGVWLWRISEADKARQQIKLKEQDFSPTPLDEWHRYHLDTIAMYGNRLRLLEDVRNELQYRLQNADSGEDVDTLKQRLDRYSEIRSFCQDKIDDIVKESKEQVECGARSEEDHEEIIDFARPYLTTPGRESKPTEGSS